MKDWREQIQALKEEYLDRMTQLIESLRQNFGDLVDEVSKKRMDEYSLSHINKIMVQYQKDMADETNADRIRAMREKMFDGIRDELLFAGNPREVFLQLPEAIRSDMQRGMQGFLLELVINENVKQRLIKGPI